MAGVFDDLLEALEIDRINRATPDLTPEEKRISKELGGPLV